MPLELQEGEKELHEQLLVPSVSLSEARGSVMLVPREHRSINAPS